MSQPDSPSEAAAGPEVEVRSSLLGLPRRQLAEVLAPLIDRPFRVDQIYRALYERGIDDFDAITDLSKDLRRRLAERFTLRLPPVAERRADDDGTVKYLFRLADGAAIEAVAIPDRERRTICVSSQAGCALGCRFCVTGFWGPGRNLTAGEMVGQVMAIRRELEPETGLNLVFMGMGEPLLNLDQLAAALEILFEQISWRRITVSTVGIVPGIAALAGWPRRPQLAVSLHAPDDERRSAMMPVNRRYPLAQLMEVLRRFPLAANERLTFEYLMLRDFNDALADADALVRLLGPLRAKVNLIALNSDPVLDSDLHPSPAPRVEDFRRRLVAKGLPASTRESRGADVGAACGQLRGRGMASPS